MRPKKSSPLKQQTKASHDGSVFPKIRKVNPGKFLGYLKEGEWMDELRDELMDGWMDGWMNGLSFPFLHFCLPLIFTHSMDPLSMEELFSQPLSVISRILSKPRIIQVHISPPPSFIFCSQPSSIFFNLSTSLFPNLFPPFLISLPISSFPHSLIIQFRTILV